MLDSIVYSRIQPVAKAGHLETPLGRMLAQDDGGPLAEAHTFGQFDAVADEDGDVEVVEADRLVGPSNLLFQSNFDGARGDRVDGDLAHADPMN